MLSKRAKVHYLSLSSICLHKDKVNKLIQSPVIALQKITYYIILYYCIDLQKCCLGFEEFSSCSEKLLL